MSDLQQLARRYDTDKAAHAHYLRNYERYFAPLVGGDVRLLELGVFHGGSLLMWRDYFPRGIVVGLDVAQVKVEDESGRVRVYRGEQQDTSLLDRIAHECAPEGFDIVIDDCAHVGELARASFWHLFDNHLKPGGIYVVEDWGTGYWDSWVDGVRYQPRKPKGGGALYKLTRGLTRLRNHPGLQKLPLAPRVVSAVKAFVSAPQFRSHDHGMVGFVKELVDELGAGDITHPEYGSIAPHRASKFREMFLSHSHLFVVKA